MPVSLPPLPLVIVAAALGIVVAVAPNAGRWRGMAIPPHIPSPLAGIDIKYTIVGVNGVEGGAKTYVLEKPVFDEAFLEMVECREKTVLARDALVSEEGGTDGTWRVVTMPEQIERTDIPPPNAPAPIDIHYKLYKINADGQRAFPDTKTVMATARRLGSKIALYAAQATLLAEEGCQAGEHRSQREPSRPDWEAACQEQHEELSQVEMEMLDEIFLKMSRNFCPVPERANFHL